MMNSTDEPQDSLRHHGFDYKITAAKTPTVCRCGARIPIGYAMVSIGGVSIDVELTEQGVKWPLAAVPDRETAARIEPAIRVEWLRAMGEHWTHMAYMRSGAPK
jgi:hypothetical protein